MQKIVRIGGDTQQLQEYNDVVKQWHLFGLSITLKIFEIRKFEPSMTLAYTTKYNCSPHPVTCLLYSWIQEDTDLTVPK